VRRLAWDGLRAWEQVLKAGYERLMTKDEASAYFGGRTRSWVKVKQPRWTLEEDRWQRRLSAAPRSR
jgi:ATP-dependent DNA ligase